MKTLLRALIPSLCLFISSMAFAYEHGGGYHNGDYHSNNVYNNGYHNGNYHGYHNNVWYDDGLNDDESTNVVIGVPEGGYYDPSCQTVQTCTPDGECVTQQNCN
jgi:hypothetical protein